MASLASSTTPLPVSSSPVSSVAVAVTTTLALPTRSAGTRPMTIVVVPDEGSRSDVGNAANHAGGAGHAP